MLVAYGLWVVINATLRQMATDWIDSGDYPRALIRLGGMVLIAYGLLRRQRWGWWLGVLMPSFFLLFAVGAVALAVAGGEAAAPVDLGQLLVPALCLAVGVALLLTTSSRAVFRRST